MLKFFRIFILILVPLLVLSCSSIKPIELTQLKNFEIVEFKDNQLTLKADMEVNNPNPLRMKVMDADFDLKINDKVIGHISQMDALVLEANKKKDYPVTAKFKITSLKNGLLSLMQLVNRRDTHISISGTVTGKTFLYRKKFDFADIKIYE